MTLFIVLDFFFELQKILQISDYTDVFIWKFWSSNSSHGNISKIKFMRRIAFWSIFDGENPTQFIMIEFSKFLQKILQISDYTDVFIWKFWNSNSSYRNISKINFMRRVDGENPMQFIMIQFSKFLQQTLLLSK